jgi:hypothetical protein
MPMSRARNCRRERDRGELADMERAVEPYWQELEAEARATVRF